MLKGYRRRFVAFNMLLVSVVLLVALIFQGLYQYRNAYNELQNTMRLIVEPLGGAPMGLFRPDGAGSAPFAQMPRRAEESAPRSERRIMEEGILVAFYDKTRAGKDGHGLGLPIIRQMVELQGGEITASSVKGEGTQFTVTLPLAEGTQA